MGWPETDEQINSLKIVFDMVRDSLRTEISKEEESLTTLEVQGLINPLDSIKLKQLLKELGLNYERRSTEFPRIGMGSCHKYWNILQKILKQDYGIKWRTPANEQGGQKGGQKNEEKTIDTILQLVKDNPSITRKVLAQTVGISPSAIQKHINRLKADSIIVRHGGDRGGYWEVVVGRNL